VERRFEGRILRTKVIHLSLEERGVGQVLLESAG
jgi:hypothetical protein